MGSGEPMLLYEIGSNLPPVSIKNQPCRQGVSVHRLDDALNHFLGVAQQHQRVVTIEQ